ncbi:uncharacterized protein [Epargyreus clarus]|uniref:uncharacterized protein isoform X2 n=1 Tax=Epargyreus clarus TaxID=520877 RepID=UPI003C2BC55D
MSTRVKITGVPKNVRNDKLLAVLSRVEGIHTNDINVNMVMVNGPVKDILLTFNNHKHASMAQRKFNNFKYTYAQKTYVFTAKLDMGCELTNFPSTEASRLDMHIEILRKQKMVLEEEAKLLQEEQELEIIKAAAFSNPRLGLGGISQNIRPASNHDRMQPPGTVQSIPESRSRHFTGQAAVVSNQRGALGPTCRPTNGTFVQLSPVAGTSQYIRPANNDRMQPPGTAHSIPESGARHFTGQACAFCNRPTADTCVQLSPVAGTSQYIRPVSNDDRMQPPWTAQSIPESRSRHFTGQAAAVSYPRGALCATYRLPADSGVQLSPVAGTSQYIRPVSNDRMQPPGTAHSIPESGARHFTGQAAAVSNPRGALGATCRPPADSGVQLSPFAGTSQYIRPVSNDRMQPPGTAQSIPESGARHFTGQMKSIKKEQQSDSEMSLNDEDTSSDEEEPQDDPGKPAMDRKFDSKIPSRRKAPRGRYGKKKEPRRLKKSEIRKARYYRACSFLYKKLKKHVKKYLTEDKRGKMKYFLRHSLKNRLIAVDGNKKTIKTGELLRNYTRVYPPEGDDEFVRSHLKLVNEHFGKYKWRANKNTQYF